MFIFYYFWLQEDRFAHVNAQQDAALLIDILLKYAFNLPNQLLNAPNTILNKMKFLNDKKFLCTAQISNINSQLLFIDANAHRDTQLFLVISR